MPPPKRPRRQLTDDWEQLRLFVGWPEQETYEMLRPIVLFGQTAAAGEFRVHAKLAQMGLHRSPRTCGRSMAHNRRLGLPRPADPLPHEPREMPFAATYRHRYWSVDLRCIERHQLPDPKPVYVISILENYSRALATSSGIWCDACTPIGPGAGRR